MMKKLLLITVILISTTSANASGIPTCDVVGNTLNMTELVESIKQTMNQIQELANQYQQIQNQVAQISHLEDQFNSMTGNYNMGSFLNSSAQRQLRRFMPNNWFEVRQLLKKTGLPTSLAEAVDAAMKAKEQGEQYPSGLVFLDQDHNMARRYETEGDRIYSTMGLSQASFNQTEQRMTDIESMSDQIDTANDLKAAIDLGNRIDTENALLTNELIRQISILNLQETENREKWRNQLGAEMSKADMTIPDITK